MTTMTKNRRHQRRHTVSPENVARVEFDYPTPNGKQYRLPLVNISASGLSFMIDAGDELAGLEEGAGLPDAVISLGECRISGEMLVMHMTAGPDSRYLCGALFYPATDTDLVKLKSVIAGMEVAGTD
jgi:hypothetical protein